MTAVLHGTEVRPRPEGGSVFAPALGGGSGANRDASVPGGEVVGAGRAQAAVGGWVQGFDEMQLPLVVRGAGT